MEVKITFDTEKENVDDLKRLVAALQDLINKREKSSSLGNPMATANIKTPSQSRVEQKPQVQQNPNQDPAKYTGHGRLIPYEDMSGTLSSIFSGRR